ncbi:MAG TPA: heavy metal-associated domain-containing protein [Euzebyales bacterium]
MAVDVLELVVPGLRCRDDVRVVSRAIQDLDVVTVEIDAATARVVVRGEVPVQAVREAIEQAGYEVSSWW